MQFGPIKLLTAMPILLSMWAGPAFSNAEEEAPSLHEVKLKDQKEPLVGTLTQSEGRSNWVLEEVATGKKIEFRESDLDEEPKKVTDTEAITISSAPAAVVAWRIANQLQEGGHPERLPQFPADYFSRLWGRSPVSGREMSFTFIVERQ